MYCVYILESKNDKSWYIGYTGNLKQRLHDHLTQKGGKTTSRKDDWTLIYYEAYLIKLDALGRERFLKSGAGHRFIRKQLKHYFNNYLILY